MAIAVPPAAAFLGATLLVPDLPSGVRLAAGFLQLLGLAVVAWGFAAKRIRFGGRPPLFERFVKPESRGLGLVPPPTDGEADNGISGSAIPDPEAKVRVRAGADSPLDHRLDLLEQRVEQLDDEVDRATTDAENDRQELREGLRAESLLRRKTIQRVEERIAEAATEGMGREVVGFIWLGMGIAAETLAVVL